MERDKKENEKESWLIVGRSKDCPCHTRTKEEKWDEAQWKKHWASLKKGHKDNLAKLHKESRG